jgi:hypothetical protein
MVAKLKVRLAQGLKVELSLEAYYIHHICRSVIRV